uniref:Larval cuticle protein 16/17 n=1 Tax=Schizaphis graminum TaxID=13262 RepID=A0A2S2NBU9_SCHGA
MATAFIVFIATSMVVTVALAQQRPVPPAFTRSTLQSRDVAQLNLDPQQPMPQPFRRVSLPLYRGRGFSLEGQEPNKPVVTQQTFQPRPVENVDGDAAGDDAPQPTRQASQQQFEKTQQKQVDRVQQQQQNIDRIQSQPEKQLSGFRPQPQIQPIETQPNFVRKVVQRPLKRVRVTEETEVVSKSPETIQRMKLERTEFADKQRAKKPVSQVLRRYRDDNPDGSITWGFENDDGTFKEETIGVDCVTRGKYGYVDPEGVKREYSYQSGIPCDKDRRPLSAPHQDHGAGSSAVQEAQASDTSYGYIDYTKNQYVMANGQTINLNGMARNRARKPVIRKTAPITQTASDQRF